MGTKIWLKPLPSFFDLDSPKSIGYISLQVTIIMVIYSSLAQPVPELGCGGQNIGRRPPSPPLPFRPRLTKIIRVHPLTNDYNCGDL